MASYLVDEPTSGRNVKDGVSALPALASLWAESTGDPQICVAVLDGPVDLSHPSFAGANLTLLESAVSAEVDAKSASQHGTHVASVIFGQPGGPVHGIAPGCRGVIIPVFKSGEGESLSPCSQIDLARGLSLAVEHRAHVVNISGGQLDASGEADPLLANAVRLCADNGILIVAAAGNDGCECLHIPAAEPSVLVVGAMDLQGSPMHFSNWSEGYKARGILAPGENILGAAPGGGTASRSGTSFATPIISGIVALLLSIQIKQGETPDPFAARNAILNSAIGCDEQPAPNCSRLLAGRLNVVGALTHLKKGGNVEMSEQITEVPDPNKRVEGSQAQMAAGAEAKAPAVQPPVFGTQAVQSVSSAAGITAADSQPGAMKSGQAPAVPLSYAPGNIIPSGAGGGCGCGGGTPPALVYALGQISYDFSTESRRDWYVSQLQPLEKNPLDPAQLLAYLNEHPEESAGIIWTLNLDVTPIYAVQPAGPFAAEGYKRLRESLSDQLKEGAERVSVPGYTTGTVTLLSGQTVPIIFPEVRGMYSWTTEALITAVLGKAPTKKEDSAKQKEKTEGIRNFLERVYYEIRNLGLAPQERAMNYAATNAFQIEHVFSDAITQNLKLDSIDVERSPICRPGSDCWDVKLLFFDSHKRLEEARKVYRFTVDVSDVVPITVGEVRSWRIF